MNDAKIRKYIAARQKLYNFEAKQKKKLKPFEEKRKKIEAALQKVIHKGENGTQSVGLEDVICFAKERDCYSLVPEVGREQLNAHVLSPLHAFVAGLEAKKHATLIEKLSVIADEIEDNLAVFKNEAVDSYVVNYRLATGGTKTTVNKTTVIEGGDLPPGVQLYPKPTIHFNKR